MYACSGHAYHSRAGKGRRAAAKSRGIFAPNGKVVIRITVPATLTVHYSRNGGAGDGGIGARPRGVKVGGVDAMPQLFHRVWPLAALVVGLFVTVAWVGLLGYWVVRFGGLAF